MKTSESVNELYAALAKASLEFLPLNFDKKVSYGATKFAYASLAASIAATKPSLAKHGISILQLPHVKDKEVFITTLIVHASGQFLETDGLFILAKTTGEKDVGAAITYARRYEYNSLLNLAAEEAEVELIEMAEANDKPAYSEPKPPRTTAEVKERLLNDCRELYRSLSPEAKQELVSSMHITPADMPTYDVDKLLAIKSFMKDKTKVVIGQK